MNVVQLVADAQRLPSPRARDDFLKEKCGTDYTLLVAARRCLAEAQAALPDTSPAGPPQGVPADTVDDVPRADDLSFTVSPDDDGVQIGEVLAGKYKLLERIGEGGMGAVYVADQTEPVHRRVAVKLIKAGMDSGQVLARFAQERQALAVMDHPNIARIFDGGQTRAGRPYFVMELVRGLPLTDYCDQQKLNVRERVALLIPICQAVQHAHQKGIIHRDLKPSNILVGQSDGRAVPKIIDFGVAKVLAAGPAPLPVYTEINMLVGTLEYMAPEQAGHNSLDVDTRADIYSLGVIAYELLCGRLPFSRGDLKRAEAAEMLRLIREVDPKPPSTRVAAENEAAKIAAQRHTEPLHLSAALKGDLDWVVMKALAKERERRYASAQGLAADLERYVNGEPVLAAPPSARYRLGKFLRRHRGKVVAAAAGLVLLAAAAIISTVGWIRAVRAERQAQAETAVHQALVAFIQQDLFDAADPAERAKLGLPVDAEVKLRTVIDRASARLASGRFQDQPLVEAALRFTLARANHSLGLSEPARQHAERAEQLRKAHLGPADPSRLETLVLLGRIHYSSSEPQKAEPFFAEALTSRRQLWGEAHQEVLELRFFLAGLQRQAGQFAEAEAALASLWSDQRQALGVGHEDTLRTGLALADLKVRQKKLTEAEPLLTESLAVARKEYGPKHPATLNALNGLAQLKRGLKQESEAEVLYRELVAGSIAVHTLEHPLTAVYRNNLAVCLISQGRLQEALPLLLEVEPILIRVGTTHPLTLTMQGNLAYVLARVGEKRKAISKYEEILPRFLERFGDQRANTWNLMDGMAELYAELGQPEKAVEVWSRLLTLLRRQSSDPGRLLVHAAARLTQLLVELNRAAQAEQLLSELAAELPAGQTREQISELQAQLKHRPK